MKLILSMTKERPAARVTMSEVILTLKDIQRAVQPEAAPDSLDNTRDASCSRC